MLDIESETLLTLAQAARSLPKRNGKHIHFSTLWRWCFRGVRGHKLDHIRCGAQLWTSKEALLRFIEALEQRDVPDNDTAGAVKFAFKPPAPVKARVTAFAHASRRTREIAAAQATLEAAGI